MKKFLYTFLTLVVVMVIMVFNTKKPVTPESLGWKLAYQSFTFKNFTFEEGLQKASGIGLKYVEPFRRQAMSPENATLTNWDADAAARKEMKSLLKQYKIKMINYGVVKAIDEAEWKRIFDFAKEMGVETLSAEPEPSQFGFLDSLCNVYKINIAVHNHASPTRYYSPDSVLKYTAGLSPRMGACVDIGHWVRSGIDPLEALNKLEGRILSVHLKDLDKKDRKGHDVPWGTGVCNVSALLQELKDQKFKGVFSIEYEYNFDNNVDEVKTCVENFNKITATLK